MDYPGNLFVVAAPSGAGKSSLVKALLELDARVQPSVSHTTRPPRGQEKHGREYFFVSQQEFDAMVAADATALEQLSYIDSVTPTVATSVTLRRGNLEATANVTGVGEDFFPGTYDPAIIDRWVRVSDRDAFAMARRLTREEGILSGGSCGTAMVAAREIVRELAGTPAAKDAVIVVLLPDSGRSYLSKIYNDEWMRVNGLLATTGAATRVDELLADRHHAQDMPAVVVARTTQRVGEAIAILQTYGISQLPVSEDAEGDAVVGATVGEFIAAEQEIALLLDSAFKNPHLEMPLTPERVWRVIKAAQRS